VAVFDAIKRAQGGKFKGGTDVIATVENGGVGLGQIGPAGTKYEDQIKDVTDKLAAGEIPDIPDTVK
jgi:basic membrane protein A and related proteins